MELSKSKFADKYFDDWEIERAKEKDDPVSYLVSNAKSSCRGFHSSDEISYSTYSGNIEIYMAGSNIMEDPDFEFTVEEIAEAKVESLTQPDLF